jgi:hypothetical protein
MPDTSTEVAIATTTLGSAAASITFNSISSAYTDLRVVFVLRGSQASGNMNFRLTFNGDTATNYSDTWVYGTGGAAGSMRDTGLAYINAGFMAAASSSIFGLWTADVFSYKGSTFKTSLITSNYDLNGNGEVDNIVGLWRSTSAITSLTLTSSTSTFAAGTTATLYGIL